MGGALWVDVVKEARDVKKDEGASVAQCPGGLDAVGEDGCSVSGGVVPVGAKLSHRKQVEGFDVAVEAFGNNLLEDLPDTLKKADGSVGLWVAIVWLVQFVKGNDCGMVPEVPASLVNRQ